MPLSQRQREVLHEMGIPVWVRRDDRGGPTRAAETRAEAVLPDELPANASSISATVAWAKRSGPTRAAPLLESQSTEVFDPASASAAASPSTEPKVAELDWPALRKRVAACVACRELAATRTQTVFGVGDPQADWMFIGEAPGAEEDQRGEPFVGRSGQLLDNMLAALGLDRAEKVFIANIIKCRPPGNRNPEPPEMANCRGYLERQITLVEPRVIVALGRVAAQALLDSRKDLRELRGQEQVYRGIPVVVTYHPAYLLRTPSAKPTVWADLLRARALMTAPR